MARHLAETWNKTYIAGKKLKTTVRRKLDGTYSTRGWRRNPQVLFPPVALRWLTGSSKRKELGALAISSMGNGVRRRREEYNVGEAAVHNGA